MKVLLILSDGLRPDSLDGIPEIEKLKKKSTYSLNAKTVMPSVTLPCHMSLIHSVDPGIHGTTTNTYAPQVRPVSGLFEQLKKAGKKCAFFYDWEELRDLSRPGSLAYNEFISGIEYGFEKTSKQLEKDAIKFLKENDMDFTFLYLGWTDGAGHEFGWMSNEYMRAVKEVCHMIDEVIASLDDEYTVFLTADHGGHERMHGDDVPEDMTIPFFACGKPFAQGKEIENVSIKDIAPTIVKLLGADCAKEWEGRVIE